MKKRVWFAVWAFVSSLGLALAGGHPAVLIKTALGDIKVEIYENQAPLTAANFLRYVDHRLYDGTEFFRTVHLKNQDNDLVKIEVIQGGAVAEERSFPAISHETTQVTGIKHLEGVISMARSKPGTASSSFFICLSDQPELDFGGRRNPDGQGFSAFGRVIEGMDVVRKIFMQPEQNQRLTPPVKILSIIRIAE